MNTDWAIAINQLQLQLADRDAQIAELREQLDSKRVDELMADNRILKLVEELRISQELMLCPLHKKHKRFCADCATELENAEADLRVAEAYELAAGKVAKTCGLCESLQAIRALTPADAANALREHDRKIAETERLDENDLTPHYTDCATLLVTRDPYPKCTCWVGARRDVLVQCKAGGGT